MNAAPLIYLFVFLFIGTASLAQAGRDGRSWTPGEDCLRVCGQDSRICYFQWFVERYTVLGPACRNCSEGVRGDCYRPQCVPASGVKKGIVTINRQIPGPAIQVCEGDMIVVDVVNRMPDLTVTIHWHGIRQLGSPHMDGATMITQCPIQPFTTFRYTFRAEAGTHFYHSHTGSQKLDGLSGPLIVRKARQLDIHRLLYDEDRPDHVIFIQDWLHRRGEDFMPGLRIEELSQIPDAVLINGLGRFSAEGTNRGIPVANFHVERGRRYRFRLIGATCMTCAFAFRVEGHRLTAISADGHLSFKPTPVDSIVLNSADRFDFILEANQTSGSYFMLVESLNEFCREIRQVAVLRYQGGASLQGRTPPSYAESIRRLGVQLNPSNSSCDGSTPRELCVSMLEGEFDAPSMLRSDRPYRQFPVAFGFYEYTIEELFVPGTYHHYEEPIYGRLVKSLTNNVSFAFPPSPMLSQWSDIPESALCRPECFSESIQRSCSCANVYPIPLGAIVDLIVFDTGERDGFNHPFHLHGYNFYVLEMGTFVERRQDRQRHLDALMRSAARDGMNLRFKPQRDSISVPSRGYAILRFIADNPGYWLFHCHFLYHVEAGMAAVYKVGQDADIPPPPRGFPTCGNFYG